MIFGRRDRASRVAGGDAEQAAAVEGSDEGFDDTDQADDEREDVLDEDDADEAPDDEDDGDQAWDDLGVRSDGPFDHEEVDLEADDVERVAFGPLIITPFDGLNLQLTGDEQSGTIYALLALWENSALELALFAAPTSGGLAEELREDLLEEAAQGGGNAEVADGPFGPEVRRVLPLEGPEGEQLFHVSRIWLVEGPRWLLRATLMGPAAMSEGEQPPADTFVEFFRNTVVRRDDSPRVPGELITLALPETTPGS